MFVGRNPEVEESVPLLCQGLMNVRTDIVLDQVALK